MSGNLIKNTFIGTSYENGNYYIQTVDLNNDINKILLKDFLLEKEDINNSQNEKYIGFCLDCNKNINNPNCEKHSVKYFKDIIENINIKEIENNFNIIIDKYNNNIKLLEEKIKEMKKRNDELILLVKKMINIYNCSFKTNNFTFQLLLNIKNILNFNEIDKFILNEQNYSVNFNYNILKEFPIMNYIENKLSNDKIQKSTKLSFNIDIKSILLLNKMKKMIIYSKDKIILINSKNFLYEDEICSDKPIISLNLMKDKKTILVSYRVSIKKLKIENNKMILEDYLNNVDISEPGIIINYKNDIAWTNKSFIGFSSKKVFNIDNTLDLNYDQRNSRKYSIYLMNLYSYNDNTILFVYYYKTNYSSTFGSSSIFFNQYKNDENKYKNIIFDDFNNTQELLIYKNYKIYNYKDNKVIVFGNQAIFIIDIVNWSIIEKINPSKKSQIINSFPLNDSYYVIFLKAERDLFFGLYKEQEDQNNMLFINFDNKFNKIIYKANYDEEKTNQIFFNIINNKKSPATQIILIKKNKMYLYEFINLKKYKRLLLENN